MRQPSAISENLRRYLEEVSAIPTVHDKEEQLRLGRRIRKTQLGVWARNKLAEGNLGLVVSIAKQYRNCGFDFDDLIGWGNLGLMEATQRFDPGRKMKFSTYAVWWIRQAITRALTCHSRTVARPVKPVGLSLKAQKEVERFRQANNGRKPTLDELAARLGEPIRLVQRALEIQPALSLDSSFTGYDGGGIESDHLEVFKDRSQPTPFEEVEAELRVERISKILDQLTAEEKISSRERTIFVLRRGLEGKETHTLKEVGKIVGLTRERIRQIDKKAFKILRQRMLAEAGGNGNEGSGNGKG